MVAKQFEVDPFSCRNILSFYQLIDGLFDFQSLFWYFYYKLHGFSFMKNPEHLGRLVLRLTRRCLNLCNEKKAALPKRRLKPASYPGQFALSELPEEAWSRVRQREAGQKMAKKSQMISRRKTSVFCDDHRIFRANEINTSLPIICGPFHLITTKSGGLFFPKNTGKLSILFTVSQKKVPSQLDMGRSLYTVFTPVSKASFSLNKMGADFLVSRAIVGLFCLVVRIVGRKNHEDHLHSFERKSKENNCCQISSKSYLSFAI